MQITMNFQGSQNKEHSSKILLFKYQYIFKVIIPKIVYLYKIDKLTNHIRTEPHNLGLWARYCHVVGRK